MHHFDQKDFPGSFLGQKEGQVPKKDERIQGNLKDILPATLQLLKWFSLS